MTDEDDRFKYREKHTPPAGVTIKRSTAVRGVPIPVIPQNPTVDATAEAKALARAERGGVVRYEDFEDDTPVHGTASVLLAHVAHRAKNATAAAANASASAVDVRDRMATLEASVRESNAEVLRLKASIDVMTAENRAAREERVDRERRQEAREEAKEQRAATFAGDQLKLAHDYRRRVLIVLAPIITAIAGALATWAAVK